jgi:ABC-type nitrate/sulfonate/bicarbonate transport system substrate-binding protein
MGAGRVNGISLGRKGKPLQVGFLPENDCAPLVVAHEFGLFEKQGLSVNLRSQPSWRQVHDKIVHRELDAAHAPGMLPFLMNLGLTPEKCQCVTGLVMSLQGSAITVSNELRRLGVRDAATMRERMWADRNKKILTLGIPGPFTAQHFLLHQWLNSVEEPPMVSVRIEPVAVEQLFPLLKLGYLDGYCAAEPWNSVAEQAGVGKTVATSATLAPLHPEKVLLVRRDFAEERAEEHEGLIAALLEAAEWCDQPENREDLCEMLAQARFVNAPVECLRPGLAGPFGAEGSHVHSLYGLNLFARCRASEPTAVKAAWLTGRLFEFLRWGARPAGLKRVFRPDIFRRALRRTRNAAAQLEEDGDIGEEVVTVRAAAVRV